VCCNNHSIWGRISFFSFSFSLSFLSLSFSLSFLFVEGEKEEEKKKEREREEKKRSFFPKRVGNNTLWRPLFLERSLKSEFKMAKAG
jgi:hypothetical protein